MQQYTEEQLELINIYIGLNIKRVRLLKGLSQLELGNELELDNTAVGRIERAIHYSSWKTILKVCIYLNIDFRSLFDAKDKNVFINLINECYELELKSKNNTKEYYEKLNNRLEKLFD